MACRVQQDPPAVGLRLVLGGDGAQVQQPGLRGVQVVDAQIEVGPLLLGRDRPGGVLGADQAALSALLKLRQGLPPRIAGRLGELDSAFVHTPRPDERQIAPGMLLEPATVCRRGERTRLSYRDREGNATDREVDPYRLVHTGRRWYFVARDVTRGEWRTFRADRVARAQPTGQLVELVDPPDPAGLVARGIAVGGHPLYVTVRLPLPSERALRMIPPAVGSHRADGPGATVVEIGGPDADGLAKYLMSLAAPLRVLSPDDVRQALLRRTRELFEDNGGGPPS